MRPSLLRRARRTPVPARRVVLAAGLLVWATLLPAGAVARFDVEVQDNRFVPARLERPVGATVRWIQTGVLPHSVTARNGSFDSHPDCDARLPASCMKNGDDFSRTFRTSGTFEYYCKVHGNEMSGRIVITPRTSSTTSPPSSPRPTETSPGDTDPTESASPSTVASPSESEPADSPSSPPASPDDGDPVLAAGDQTDGDDTGGRGPIAGIAVAMLAAVALAVWRVFIRRA